MDPDDKAGHQQGSGMHWIRWIFSGITLCGITTVSAQEPLPVRVPEGFEVVEFADDTLAHDIFSLTIDSLGRLVVSGPGYVRILVDRDDDGRADIAIPFANGPKSGAQGMFFHGRTLLCVGDAGLLRFRDQDGDDKADGPADTLLKLQTGGEHDAHSIQHGPDGWWYLIAGNSSKISSAYASLPTSPVKRPRAGAVLRFLPDLSAGEIVADGIRNAYDFAFHRQGDIFTYDSDDERDVSMPWYRPTRVFDVVPGSDLGWVSRSWKRPNSSFDMPPVLGSFGRGSPTGLVSYQHRQFPAKYQDAVFALDWTYGRVLCLKLSPSGATWHAEPEVFMSGQGSHGFAPTDLEVGPDGSLYVCVGGRGTRGGVYRIRAKNTPRVLSEIATADDCVAALQPLSSWSRARWVPIAKKLGAAPYIAIAEDEARNDPERIRAIEIVTELFGGLDAPLALRLLKSSSPLVRAQTMWSCGRTSEKLTPDLLSAALRDRHARVARASLEAAQTWNASSPWDPVILGIVEQAGSDDRVVRQLVASLIPRMPAATAQAGWKLATAAGPRNQVTYAAGWLAHPQAVLATLQPELQTLAVSVLKEPGPPDLKLDALRLLQWLLGDLGPSEKHPPAFDGYSARIPVEDLDRDWDTVRSELAELYPLGLPLLDEELSRVLAMLAPVNQKLLEKVLANLTDDSDPIADLHTLLVAAKLPVTRTTTQRMQIATALVRLDEKITQRKLPQDNAWNDRFRDLYTRLAELDEFLAPIMVDVPGFGRAGHVLFMSQMPPQRVGDAIAAFATQAAAENYVWTNDVVFLIGASPDPAHRALLKQQYERFAVRGAVLMTLAEMPEAVDRPWFRAGLESSQAEVLAGCLGALETLPADDGPDEQMALLKALRRLGQDEREFAARDRVVALLERNTGHKVPYVSGPEGRKPQRDAVAAWTTHLQERWPKEFATGLGSGDDLAGLADLLAKVDWEQGDRVRGKAYYEKRACGQCHGGRSALGPDLTGAAERFSRSDLFTAIVAPSRDVSARYQTTLIETEAGKAYAGMIVYESVDGLLLRNATLQTFRIEAVDIADRKLSPVSLMPNGLMKDATPQDYADLFAYLRTLGTAAAP